MSKRNPKLLLADILDAVEKIKRYTTGLNYDTFIEDSKTLDAVIRNFEVIGGAANKLPNDFKDKHLTVDWFRIIGFRNRIVQDYMGVDYKIVWAIITNDIEKLFSEIENIFNSI
ncbi:MAG TPA: DUF86 domain-containing protein [Bacteroidia bacterium]|nr:DUF86 domain-containing protein [Bacteroidia bacterium]